MFQMDRIGPQNKSVVDQEMVADEATGGAFPLRVAIKGVNVDISTVVYLGTVRLQVVSGVLKMDRSFRHPTNTKNLISGKRVKIWRTCNVQIYLDLCLSMSKCWHSHEI